MIRKIPTGIFVTSEESKEAVQRFGIYLDNQTDYNKSRLNNYLKKLAEKYGYEWSENELAPNGEVIHVIKDNKKEEYSL